jgi:hypothetical protein
MSSTSGLKNQLSMKQACWMFHVDFLLAFILKPVSEPGYFVAS